VPKRRLILACCTAVVIAVTVTLLLWPNHEPMYHGHSLSYWLDESCAPTMVRQHEATQAILQMGTNALPGLLQHLKHKPGAWTSVTSKFSKLRESPHGYRFIPRWLSIDRPAVRAEMAVYALIAPGEPAAPAYPELLVIACDPTQPKAAQRAVRVLTLSTNALGLVLSSGCPNIRVRAIHQIGMWHDQTLLQALRPALIQQLHDDDDNVAISAAGTLSWLKLTQPEATLPVFIEALGSPKSKVRAQVIQEIATFGTLAVPAVPSVAPLLLDPDLSVRKEATNLLRMIAPEVFTNTATRF